MINSMTTLPLMGVKVLVTRPAHQSDHLCHLIEQAGGQPLRFPVIEVAEVEDNTELLDCIEHLDEFDMAIFISVNAVDKALPTLIKRSDILNHMQIAAVGKRTAETIEKWGFSVLYPDPPFNSESLLKMPELQSIEDKNIVIFRGEGGREILADGLRQRGATVEYVNVYQRIQPAAPQYPPEPVDVITITSGEGLQNLFAMLAKQEWLVHTPLIVISSRMVTQARQLGIKAPLFVANSASDEGLLTALLGWRSECKT